jgi:hypothetical protein
MDGPVVDADVTSDEDEVGWRRLEAMLRRFRKAGPMARAIGLLANMDADVLAGCLWLDRTAAVGLTLMMLTSSVVSSGLVFITLTSVGWGTGPVSLELKVFLSAIIGISIFLFDRWVIGAAASQPARANFEQNVDRHFARMTTRRDGDSTQAAARTRDPVADLRARLSMQRAPADQRARSDDDLWSEPVSVADQIWFALKRGAIVAIRFGIALILSTLFAIGAELTIFGGAINDQINNELAESNKAAVKAVADDRQRADEARRDEATHRRQSIDENIAAAKKETSEDQTAIANDDREIEKWTREISDNTIKLARAKRELGALRRQGEDDSSPNVQAVESQISELGSSLQSFKRKRDASVADEKTRHGRIDQNESKLRDLNNGHNAVDREVATIEQSRTFEELLKQAKANGQVTTIAKSDFLARFIALQHLKNASENGKENGSERGAALRELDHLLIASLIVLELMPLIAIMIFGLKSSYSELYVSALRQRVHFQIHMDQTVLSEAVDEADRHRATRRAVYAKYPQPEGARRPVAAGDQDSDIIVERHSDG